MKVNADLLERYHNKQCNAGERRAVEDWLMNKDLEPLKHYSVEQRQTLQQDIWSEIVKALPDEIPVKERSAGFYIWKGAIAASLVFVFILSGLYFLNIKNPAVVKLVSFTNSSSFQVSYINSTDYYLSVAPGTSANINEQNGKIDLIGSILLTPKKDIRLRFDGIHEDVSLREGQTYIILNSENDPQGLIVLTEKNLINLPPVIQKKLIQEFNI